MIHPSAVISPEARLAPDVRVGAHVVIDGPAEIGPGCVLGPGAVLLGRVALGARCRIGSGAVLGGDPQDLGFDPATDSGVRLGEDNVVREHVTIHRATRPGQDTTVGDKNYLMAGVHLAHDVAMGSHNVVANNTLFGGHVRVGDRAVFGGGCVFHQHVRVGDGVMTQGISGYGKDIPPFCLGAKVNEVFGLNAVGLRRAGAGPDERRELQRAFQLLYRAGKNTREALAAAGEESWGPRAQAFWDFVRVAMEGRGICAWGGSSGDASPRSL